MRIKIIRYSKVSETQRKTDPFFLFEWMKEEEIEKRKNEKLQTSGLKYRCRLWKIEGSGIMGREGLNTNI